MPNWTKEQIDAIELDNTNIIVSAGAGSGKTAVLTERVIHKLKKGVNIDELLILTFTKAAAREMKERIRKNIIQNKLDNQLDKIDSAYITTFDSYALSIVKKYNYLLNVGKNISVVDSSIISIKKDELLDELFEELYEEQNPMFLKLISDFYTKDDTDFKEQVLLINDKLDMRYDKDIYLDNYIDNYFSDKYIDSKVEEYIDLLREKISTINSYYIQLEEYVDSDYYDKVSEVIEPLLTSKNYKEIKESILKLPDLPRNSEEETKLIKKQMSKVIDELLELCEYENIEEIKNNIFATKDYTKVIIDIIKRLDKKISQYKDEINSYEFTDIAKMAIKVLEENEEVRNELKYSLKEIMIDEYQDTNDLQDKFILLIENNNVYMVGDIKQSIYRFRNANPNLFKQKYDDYSNNNGGIKIDLNKNFRSRSEVLNDINVIFEMIMNNNIGGASYKETHKMIYGNSNYDMKPNKEQNNDLEILMYNESDVYSKEEIEIFAILKDIKNKVENKYQVFDKDEKKFRNIEYKDFAILMDRSKNFELYKKIFEYYDVPIQLYKDEVLNDSVDLNIIKNIINLFICEDEKAFKYSFMSVARSYLFQMNDNKIFDCFINDNFNDTEIMTIINIIDITSMTPLELLNNIIDKFNFYEKIITVGDIEKHINAIESILSLTESLTNMGYTITDFYDYLDKISKSDKYKITISNKEDKDGVKIMTIHASKGLEYHICYYAGLYEKFNIRDLNDRFLYDNKYGIITPIFDNGIRTTIYKTLLKNSYIKEEISEKIRLFYVALTRSKEKMIMIAPIREETTLELTDDIKLKYRSFLDILNSIKDKMTNYISEIDLNELGLNKNYNLVKKSNYKEKIKTSNDVIKVEELKLEEENIKEEHFSKENHSIIDKTIYENINFGKKIHSIFENIDFENPDYSNLNSFEKAKVEAFINKGLLKDVVNVYKEFEFTYNLDDVNYHGIIDLLLEYKDEFKIIDYKLKNITDDAYLKQLNGYKKYIESITDKKVSIYLYSIIDETLQNL